MTVKTPLPVTNSPDSACHSVLPAKVPAAAAPLRTVAARGLAARIQNCGSDTMNRAAPPPGSQAIAPTAAASTHR